MFSFGLLIVFLFANFVDPTISVDVDFECTPLRECSELYNLLKENPSSSKVIRLLKNAQCGFENNKPKVWCARLSSGCKTPAGNTGKCIPLKECKPLFDVVVTNTEVTPAIKNFIQQFECQHSKYIETITVCCPQEKELLIEEPTPNLLPNPSEEECGEQLLTKIIGGTATQLNEFPWTALLEYEDKAKTFTPCAGSVINKKYVITAAHCVDNAALRSVGKLKNVVLGEFDKATEKDCVNFLGIEGCADPLIKIPIEEIIIHPEWYKKAPGHINHDVALLRLSESINFTYYIQPICLPPSDLKIPDNERLTVVGWGSTEKEDSSNIKLKTTVPVANKEKCAKKYYDDKRLVVGDGEFCVGGEEGADSCTGDSGGPLMMASTSNGPSIWFLAGIVSFGPNKPCGQKDYPALYTFIPRYVEWIRKTVKP